MAVIVTRPRPDGTYDEVGMNYRRLYALKTQRGIVNRVLNSKFCKSGEKIRMEWFAGGNILGNSYATTYVVL